MASIARYHSGRGPVIQIQRLVSLVRYCERLFILKQRLRRNVTMSKKAAEHHLKAAEHHEHAARHHREAAKHHQAGSHEKAAHHAHTARAHHEHADEHAIDAAKAHAEEHGGK
jgi:hypothetical protein